MKIEQSRRDFLRRTALTAAGTALAGWPTRLQAQLAGERPRSADGVEVLNPRGRVPVGLIIDDSTCLVNLNRFAIPQFAEAFGTENRYREYAWRDWPVEIPDDFVRRFGEWCGEQGVKGKYSVVPFPACVGRLDRLLPGWTRGELEASIDLVRNLMTLNWDIHPEMVTHTRVVDIRTGHPFPERSPEFMENWEWTTGKSVDEIGEYLAYALRILKNVGLDCEGITTPGGFGNRALPELSQATLRACREVYEAEIPHYFRHLYDRGERSVAPRVEYASGLKSADPQCVVSIIGCTGDWTGGWDCSSRGDPDRFITGDLKTGRMVEVIERGEPALMVCHWTGIYWNGEAHGFRVFREVVRRLHSRFDSLIWMKLSEIARYWAAKELTSMRRTEAGVEFKAPFAAPDFTVRFEVAGAKGVRIEGRPSLPLREVASRSRLAGGTWLAENQAVTACFDLPKGTTRLRVL